MRGQGDPPARSFLASPRTSSNTKESTDVQENKRKDYREDRGSGYKGDVERALWFSRCEMLKTMPHQSEDTLRNKARLLWLAIIDVQVKYEVLRDDVLVSTLDWSTPI